MTSSGDLELGDAHKDPTPQQGLIRLLWCRRGSVLQRMRFNPVHSGSGVCRSHVSAGGLSACCGLGALWGEPRPVLEGTCPAHSALSLHDDCVLRRCVRLHLHPHCQAWCQPVSASGPGRGWRSSSDYETGSEEEDGWPAGGAGGGPFSLCS